MSMLESSGDIAKDLVHDNIKYTQQVLDHADRLCDIIRELPLPVDIWIKVQHLMLDSWDILEHENDDDKDVKHVAEVRFDQDLNQLKRIVSYYDADIKRL